MRNKYGTEQDLTCYSGTIKFINKIRLFRQLVVLHIYKINSTTNLRNKRI